MAKKKENKKNLRIIRPSTTVITLPQVDQDGLLPYQHFVDASDNSFRIFYEEPTCIDEVNNVNYPNKSYVYAGHFSRTLKANSFWLVGTGKNVVGDDIAKKFAQLLTKKIRHAKIAKKTATKIVNSLKSFFYHLSEQPHSPKTFAEIKANNFSLWCDSLEPKNAANAIGHIKILITGSYLGYLKSIRIQTCKPKSKSQDLSKLDFDAVVEPFDYSDSELIQILAYVFYDIDKARDQFELLQNVSVRWLGENYLPLDNISTNDPTLVRLFTTGKDGHYWLLANFTLHLKYQSSKTRFDNIDYNATKFAKKLREVNKTKRWRETQPYKDYISFLHRQYWPTSLEGLQGQRSMVNNKWFTLQTLHHEFSILIYFLITTGVNLETALSLEWSINNKPWHQNFDIEMGISEDSAPREQSILLIGSKARGQKRERGVKKIEIPISINSPLYSYLRFLDKTRPNGRRFIFSLKNLDSLTKAFCSFYPIFSSKGERFTSLQTMRFRKVFAGHELMKLLKDVKNADELVSRLKTALNHENFDTTFFSYIMKSGLSNLSLDSAIVALTSDMLEKAMTFRGKVKEDNSRSKDTHHVFLCDCSDPSNPSHGLPVADRCRAYDLCLGCERSEVYAEHLPAICYRILQYEEMRKLDTNSFNAIMVDRLHIALDTVKQFQIRHSNGTYLVEHAYAEANRALVENSPLVPPILQTGMI